MRRNGKKGLGLFLLARWTSVDQTIRKGVHDLPAEQKHHTPNEGPSLQDHGTQQHASLHPSSHGPDHRITQEPRLQQHPNHRRSQVLTGGHLPTLSESNYGTTNCAALLQTSLPLVQAPQTLDIGPRPPLYIPLWPSAGQRTWYHVESINSISPSDRRTNRAKEPMGRTVPMACIHQSEQLVHNAPTGHLSTQ